MASTGSAARRYQANASAGVPFAPEDTSFVTVDGGGLDARVREGVSGTLTRTVCAVILASAVLLGIGLISVGFTSNTVAILKENSSLKSDIKALRATNDDLRIECSLLTSADRVSRIATQNLGMVYAQDARHFEMR